MNDLFHPVENFCNNLIRHPGVTEFKNIRRIIDEKAVAMDINLPKSYQNNLLRKVKNSFSSLNFVHKGHNSVLVFPNTLDITELVLKYHTLSLELETTRKLNKEELSIRTDSVKWIN